MGKEEISSFPTMFSTQSEILSPFVNMFDMISLFDVKLEEPKIGILGIGLTIQGGSAMENIVRRKCWYHSIFSFSDIVIHPLTKYHPLTMFVFLVEFSNCMHCANDFDSEKSGILQSGIQVRFLQ